MSKSCQHHRFGCDALSSIIKDHTFYSVFHFYSLWNCCCERKTLDRKKGGRTKKKCVFISAVCAKKISSHLKMATVKSVFCWKLVDVLYFLSATVRLWVFSICHSPLYKAPKHITKLSLNI